jgi:probable HAF family extracellular repeat protein
MKSQPFSINYEKLRLAINVRGQVVGGSTDCNNFLHAFLWEDGGPMLDLNTLIPPNSGVQLLEAININDRGEILAISVPLGAIPNTDMGRLVLLVPCDAESDEGCRGSAEAQSTILPSSGASTLNHAVLESSPQRGLTPREIVAARRAQMLRRYHLAGLNTPKN